jgi:hypothetical protein
MVFLKSISHLEGHIAVMGVYKVSTAYIISYLVKSMKLNKKVFLFDTFSGTPSISKDDNMNRDGFYSDVSLNEVKLFLSEFEDYVIFKQGLIPIVFESMENTIFSFIHLHLNLYVSTKSALEYSYDKLTHGGVILISDYGLHNCKGVKKATDEYCHANNINKVYLPTGQCIIMKNKI